MKVLVACEYSGIVRDAFLRRGHDAISCDILPTETPGPHIIGDAVESAYSAKWDLIIAHPPCTYLTSAAEWLYRDTINKKLKPGTLYGNERRKARKEAAEFFMALYDAPADCVCVENPVGYMSRHFRPADQYIQPYEFGHDASKKTGLWLRNLPPLKPTKFIAPRIVQKPNGKKYIRWANQTDSGQNNLPPSETRGLDRAKTYPGIADAMAEQWGALWPV